MRRAWSCGGPPLGLPPHRDATPLDMTSTIPLSAALLLACFLIPLVLFTPLQRTAVVAVLFDSFWDSRALTFIAVICRVH